MNNIRDEIHNYELFVEHVDEDLSAADTADRVLAIQDQLLEIINNSGRLFEQLHQPRQSSSIPASEISEMTAHLTAIVAHAKTTLITVENKQHERVHQLSTHLSQEELVGPQIDADQADVKSIDDLFVVLSGLEIPARLVTKFKDLVVRFAGGEATTGERRYSKADIELLIELEPLLLDVPETAQLRALVGEVRWCIQSAFSQRLESLQASRIPGAPPGRNDPERFEYICACHDLYWGFHCPFDDQIAFREFIDICETLESSLSLREFLKQPALDENLQLKVAFLDTQKGVIQTHANTLKIPLSPAELTALFDHKIAYLQKKRLENRAKLSRIPDVAILGGGPGGLMRALTGGLKGAEIQVFEKRDLATRPNMIKLGDVPSLHYFGVLALLQSKHQLGLLGDQPNVQIMHLEEALKETTDQLLGPNVVHTGQELVDIRVGQEDRLGPIEAGCLIKSAGSAEPATWQRADMIVDSTGAGAAVARILGNPREEYSKPMCMVATVILPRIQREDGSEVIVEVAPFQDRAPGWHSVKLETPNREYLLIQPDSELQAHLMTLQTEMRSLPPGAAREDKSREIQRIITDIAVSKARQKLGQDVSPEDVESVSAFPVQVGSRQPAVLLGTSLVMQSGDALTTPDPKTGLGANTAMKGATLFSKALDDLADPLVGPGQSYRNFVFGSAQQSKVVIDVSAAVREAEGSFATVAYAVKQLRDSGAITQSQGDLIQRLIEKQKHKIAFTSNEKRDLDIVMQMWEAKKETFDMDVWYDLFDQVINDLYRA